MAKVIRAKKTSKKLIRDRIPDIIIEKGDTPITRVLDKKEFLIELVAALHNSAKRKRLYAAPHFVPSELRLASHKYK